MRKILERLMVIVLTMGLFGCNTQSDGEKILESVDVVVISGQSNAAGISHSEYLFDTLGEDKYNEYLEGYSDIEIAFDCWTKEWPENEIIYYSTNKSYKDNFVRTMLGQGYDSTTFGPEIGIAETLHSTRNKKLFLIKYACGATCLEEDWKSKDFLMFKNLINYVEKQIQNLKQKGYDPTIKAICWMQGEGDAFEGYYQKYLTNLRTLVTNLRNDLSKHSGGKEIAFIDAGISDSYVWTFYEQINQAKIQFASENTNNIYIDTIASGLHTNLEPANAVDIYHYDSESEILLGRLFASKLKQFI